MTNDDQIIDHDSCHSIATISIFATIFYQFLLTLTFFYLSIPHFPSHYLHVQTIRHQLTDRMACSEKKVFESEYVVEMFTLTKKIMCFSCLNRSSATQRWEKKIPFGFKSNACAGQIKKSSTDVDIFGKFHHSTSFLSRFLILNRVLWTQIILLVERFHSAEHWRYVALNWVRLNIAPVDLIKIFPDRHFSCDLSSGILSSLLCHISEADFIKKCGTSEQCMFNRGQIECLGWTLSHTNTFIFNVIVT